MERNGSSLAMRLFATWDIDRTTPSTVQRVFNLSINRIVLDGVPAQVNSIVITAKLSESKRGRNLRSNDIAISPDHGRVDFDCDLCFSIQYPHFLKRKANCLQILIQRRRKYKNRLPGGFKTLAGGVINLTQVMQQGGLREITLWPAGNELQQKNDKKQAAVHSVGRLLLASCYSQAVELVDDRERSGSKKTHEGVDSEDDSDSDYDEMPLDSDLNEPSSARSDRLSSRNQTDPLQRRQRKNLKQKLTKLIRRFNKIPDDAQVAAEVASTSEARPPTKQELDALFEELSDFSDSGPENVGDDVSIGSNPRPGLQPFFTRSREVLPAINDRDGELSESDGDVDDAGWSSETDNVKDRDKDRDKDKEKENQSQSHGSRDIYAVGASRSGRKDSVGGGHSPFPLADGMQTPHKSATRVLSTGSAGGQTPSGVPHSQTMTSISYANAERTPKSSVQHAKSSEQRSAASFADQLSSLLDSDLSQRGDCVWLTNFGENPSLQPLAASLPIINCGSSQNVRQIVVHIVNKIQNFCNTNSKNPPLTWVGVIGGDRIFSQVLRSYVDCLSHKSSANWLQYLRFAPLPATNSLLAKLIEGVDHQLDALCRDVWDRWPEMSASERANLVTRLSSWPRSQTSARLNLPIGEALLQLAADRIGDGGPEGGRIFLPFLCEVRVAMNTTTITTTNNSDVVAVATSSSSAPALGVAGDDEPMNSVLTASSATTTAAATTTTRAIVGDERDRDNNGTSPPHSPHSRSDVRELLLEYWGGANATTSTSNSNLTDNKANLQDSGGNLTPSGTPNSKKDAGKSTSKASFKILLVSRILAGNALTLTYVKEKRKEKMLQKLGMKKGQKADSDNAPVQIPSVCRMLCSASGKHNELNVMVDGNTYAGIRYFQTSPQWQTHVKAFPIALFSASTGLSQHVSHAV